MTRRRPAAEALDLGVDALAVWRLTRLVTEDKITERQRDWVAEHAPDGVAYLVTCPHCVSIHLGAGVAALRIVAPRLWAPAARMLALSALTSLKTEYFETFGG